MTFKFVHSFSFRKTCIFIATSRKLSWNSRFSPVFQVTGTAEAEMSRVLSLPLLLFVVVTNGQDCKYFDSQEGNYYIPPNVCIASHLPGSGGGSSSVMYHCLDTDTTKISKLEYSSLDCSGKHAPPLKAHAPL